MSNIFQKPPQNYNYVVGLANSIDFESTPVIQSGVVSNQPLQDVVIPGNAFVRDGQKVIVCAYGIQTTITTLSQLSITLNAAQVAIHNTTVDGVSRAWNFVLELVRRDVDLLIFAFGQLNIPITTTTFASLAPSVSQTTLSSFNFAQDITLLFRYTGNNAGSSMTQQASWASIQ